MRSKSLLGTPICHRGVQVGHLYLAEREGGDGFTAADEEVLMLFAAQAATAIASARTHRDERRARTDLETLIETSPVGVVVFDAASGRPVSLNREVRRIVEPLRCAGRRHPEELLEVRHLPAGGRTGESRWRRCRSRSNLSVGETVRAEEMTLSLPDGRERHDPGQLHPDPVLRRAPSSRYVVTDAGPGAARRTGAAARPSSWAS